MSEERSKLLRPLSKTIRVVPYVILDTRWFESRGSGAQKKRASSLENNFSSIAFTYLKRY